LSFYRDNNYENSRTTNDTQIAEIGIDKLMRCISILFNETKANIIPADISPSLLMPAPSQCEDIDTNEPQLPHQQEEISSPQNMPLDSNNPQPQQIQPQYKKLQKSNGYRPINSKICKFWEQGDCRFGNDCRYLHTVNTQYNSGKTFKN
jgi:hypothetical protein